MEKLRLYIGSHNVTRDGRSVDETRPVSFVGELVCARSQGDTRGVTESLYRLEDGSLVVHLEHWSRWQGEPNRALLIRVESSGLDAYGRFELLGHAAGMARDLTVDEACSASEQADVPF